MLIRDELFAQAIWTIVHPLVVDLSFLKPQPKKAVIYCSLFGDNYSLD